MCLLSFAKQHAKFSNLLSYPSTLSASPKTNRIMSNPMSFSYLSSSSNFLVLQPLIVYRWPAETLTVEASPLWQPLVLLWHRVLCPVPQTSALKQLVFSGRPCTQAVVHKHLIYEPSLPTYRSMGNSEFSLRMPLSKVSFRQSSGWLTNY